MILLVTYDLHSPERDYSDVLDLLRKAESSHPMGSVWLLDTEEPASMWRDRLKRLGDLDDEFLVVRLRGGWASYGMDKAAVQWLKSPGRSW